MQDFKFNGLVHPVRNEVEPGQMQVKRGLLNGFRLTSSGLTLTVAIGEVISALGKSGLTKITGSDNLFPDVTDSQTTYAFWNHKTGAVSYSTSQTPTNNFDVFLGTIVASGGSIAEIRLGEWLNYSGPILGQAANMAATGYRGHYDHYGNATYYLGATVVPITDFTTTTGTLLIRRITKANVASTIDTISLTNQTAAPEDVAGAPNIRTVPAPVLILPGERIVAQVSVAAGGGTGNIQIHLGGGLKNL